MTTPIPDRSSATVFDIYFLQSFICSKLTPRDLRRCCLVSQDFYRNFSPYLYQNITILRKATYNKFTKPESLAALARHGHCVTHFTCVFAQVWKLLFVPQSNTIEDNNSSKNDNSNNDSLVNGHNAHNCLCPNLIFINSPSLPRRLQNRERNKLEIPHIVSLLQSCPRLHTLQLGQFLSKAQAMTPFCSAVRSHPSLRSLKIDQIEYVTHKLVCQVLWSTLQLESFYWNIMAIIVTPPHITVAEAQALIDLTGQEDPVFAVKELEISFRMYDHDDGIFFRFLRRCPNVTRLTIPDIYHSRCVPALATIIRTTIPNLQHLDVRISASGDLVAQLIAACKVLRSFKSNPSQMNMGCVITALVNHHRDTLQELNLVLGYRTDTVHILTILSSFPRLEVFEALSPLKNWPTKEMEELPRRMRGDPILSMDDMAMPGTPWLCTELKVLKLKFMGQNLTEVDDDFESDDDEQQALDIEEERMVRNQVFPIELYKKIGQLTKLEVLWLARTKRLDGTRDFRPLGNSVNHNAASGSRSGTQEEAGQVDEERARQRAARLQEPRTRNMGDALRELTKLQRLRQLELRYFNPFISKDDIREARKSWRSLEWLRYN